MSTNEATRETVRAELVAEVGECCYGSDPLCSSECLVIAALRRRHATRAPASAAPEREWTEEQRDDASDIASVCMGEIDAALIGRFSPMMDTLCAAIAARAPHFAPRPKVRVPSGYMLPATPEASLRYALAASNETDKQWREAVRSAGIEIEGASDEA